MEEKKKKYIKKSGGIYTMTATWIHFISFPKKPNFLSIRDSAHQNKPLGKITQKRMKVKQNTKFWKIQIPSLTGSVTPTKTKLILTATKHI